MQASDLVHCSLCYPLFKSPQILLCYLSVACSQFLACFTVQFSRCMLQPFARSDRNARSIDQTLRFDLTGGGYRTRTGDPLLARQALSQLSYTPIPQSFLVVGPSGLEPPTSRLSVVRSSQLSYGPVRFAALQRAPSKLNNVTTLRSTITDLGHCSKLSSAEFSLERR